MDTRIKYKFCRTSDEVADALMNLGFKLDSKKEQIAPEIKSFVSPSKLTEWSGWQLNPESIEHTLKYCIDKLALKSQIFVIHKGKLHTLIHIHPKNTAEEYLPRLKKLNKNLKWPYNFRHDNIEFEVDENFYKNKNKNIRFLSCIIKPLYSEDENENSEQELIERNDLTYYGKLLSEVNEHYDLPDGLFFMTATDNLTLRDDGKEPWINVVGGKVNLYSHDYSTHIPILNCSTAKNYRDIPLPTFDDWDYVTLNKPNLDKVELNWKHKKPVAVFRGGATGCGFTVKSNPRIKAAILSKKFPNLLDAKITGMSNKTLKIHEYEGVGYNLPHFFGFKDVKKNKIPYEIQSTYKYMVHIDGNVAAYRLGTTLLLNVVILLVDSGSRLWFQHMMKPYVHYVPVKADLSDLIDKIRWCKSHDKECEIIASNAYKLGENIMTKKACIDYVAATFWGLANI